MRTTQELRRIYLHANHPIECENGCGKVFELTDALRSYENDNEGNPKLICEECAKEYGHLDEDIENS